MKRRLIIGAAVAIAIAAVADARSIEVGPDRCPLPAQAAPYISEDQVGLYDLLPRGVYEDGLFLAYPVRLGGARQRFYLRLEVDPDELAAAPETVSSECSREVASDRQ